MNLPDPYYQNELVTIYHGDCLKTLKQLPDEHVNCCVTSPPYWGLRSYLPDGVKLKKDTPDWVKKELIKRGIKPFDNTSE